MFIRPETGCIRVVRRIRKVRQRNGGRFVRIRVGDGGIVAVSPDGGVDVGVKTGEREEEKKWKYFACTSGRGEA